MLKKLTLFSLFLSTLATQAQVSDYNFFSAPLTYQPLATVPGATVVDHSVEDDLITPQRVNLPFTFKLGNTDHQSIGIGENGFVWFGVNADEAVVLINPMMNSQDISVEGIISAIGFDLHPLDNNATKVRSGYYGTAPNRIFVVEWANTTNIDALFDPQGPADMSFQIRLHETSNSVELAYGGFTLNPNFALGAEVGMKTSDTDFNVRQTTTDWSQTQPGTSMADFCGLFQSIKPVLGLRMMWQPANLSNVSFDNQSIGLYPVPASDVLRVGNDKYSGNTYAIYDLSGRSVQMGTLATDAIEVSDLASGQYVLRIVGENETVSAKFLKS
ncbi:T9SS type A sorting domain-containing protein [Flavobacterium sp.]|uniref:T9SS type A sorting domain-containing protein n=1 Tax=Flavobacterium sp. TaxID=239 RepID=UPI0039E3E47C